MTKVIEVQEKSSDWWVTANLRDTPERKQAVDQLIEMHKYKRVAGSKTERKFIHNFIKPVKGLQFDKYGNMFVQVGTVPILWSSHTDSVHEKKGMQRVGFDHKEIGVAAEDTSGSSCLGADDAVGVWLMLQMLDAAVPGLYVFHRDEESGRKGSQWIAEHNKGMLAGIQFAVARDRRGTDNFITHQMGSRCCSEDWANQLITLLNASGKLKYVTDRGGSFTDTASYVDHIGECTNLSVGYHSAHSKFERLDLEHAFNLRDVLCSPEFVAGLSTLVAKREPGEKEVYHYYSGGHNHYYNHSYQGPEWAKRNNERWTEDEQDFWDRWGYEGGSMHSGTNGHTHTVDKYRGAGHGLARRSYNGRTLSGTQVGTTVTENERKLRDILKNGGPNEANPDGSGVLMLPPIKSNGGADHIAVRPPEDDDDGVDETNYEEIIKLIKYNPEATLELLATYIDDNPEIIADILDSDGLKYEDFRKEILEMYGVCKG